MLADLSYVTYFDLVKYFLPKIETSISFYVHSTKIKTTRLISPKDYTVTVG